MPIPLAFQRHAIADALLRYAVPAGWFALLSGLFWIGDRSLYHKLYYLTLAAPTLLIIVLQPQWLGLVRRVTLINLFLLFAAYMLLSLLWSPTDASWLSLAKRPLYITLVFVAAVLLAQHAPQRLASATEWAAISAVLTAVVTIGIYVYRAEGGRLTGYGALYNALKTTHVFGFFAVYWLCRWYQHPTPWAWTSIAALAVLGLLLLLTGSRAPLLAMAVSLAWLAAAHARRQHLVVIVTAGLVTLVAWQCLLSGDSARGLSYRPAIWAEALRQMDGRYWLGLGLEHPQVFKVDGLDEALADTHGTEMGVLFQGGIVGLGLWLVMYAYALGYAWRNRQRSDVLLAGALVIFGLVAGLTEGSAFLSRPKEHWFLLWIPLALLAATQYPPGSPLTPGHRN